MALPDKPSLTDIRAEIDRIDEAMHVLLMERGAIIDRLIDIKQSEEQGSAFRPHREAAMMAALVKRHRGKLPVELVAHIWRQIISTFTYIQAAYAVHLLSGPLQERARELARYHFGFSVPLMAHATPAALIEAVAGERGDLGFIHLASTPGAWWRSIGRGKAPMVMAGAPATIRAPQGPRPEALVIGNTGFDIQGLDRRLVGIHFNTDEPLAPSDDILAQAVEEGQRHVLAWGPVGATDDAIAAYLAPKAPLAEVWTLGYTAKPVSI